jgi:L-cysteate sulfo-lyase
MSLAQALNSLPRRRLLDGPTPIRRLHGIENALGSSSNRVQIYAKRDDLMSLGGGGNKLRKLEVLLGDAAAAGADTIIATGGRQSNFARLAAAAAAKLGLANRVQTVASISSTPLSAPAFVEIVEENPDRCLVF